MLKDRALKEKNPISQMQRSGSYRLKVFSLEQTREDLGFPTILQALVEARWGR
jgi:hypothetical protein